MLKSWQTNTTGNWVISIGVYFFVWISYDFFSCFSDSSSYPDVLQVIGNFAFRISVHSALGSWKEVRGQLSFYPLGQGGKHVESKWQVKAWGNGNKCPVLGAFTVVVSLPRSQQQPILSVFWGSGSMLCVAFVFLSPKQVVNHPPEGLHWL